MSDVVFRTYLRKIENAYQRGNATEHTYRSSLQELLESLFPDVAVTNEPKRIKCGAPDYILTKGQIPLGYIEAKDIGISLEQIEADAARAKPTTREGEQLKRYLESLSNLIFTDYVEFRWYVKGKRELVGRLATVKGKHTLLVEKSGIERVQHLLQAFIQVQTSTVTDAKELAARMAAIARLIRVTIERVFEDDDEDKGSLQSQFDGFKQVLLPDLNPRIFSDMYAQTICYGLFAARCNQPIGPFTREKAGYDIPKTNPFLRRMFNYIAGVDLDERINWAVDSLAELLNRADIETILQDFGKRTRQEDPIVHFYETFLSEYDQTMREKRGVYYTPEPVVSYIVRSVDQILKTTFQLPDGLADSSKIQGKTASGQIVQEAHRVQILDPATGTGTFLYSVIDLVHESFKGNQGIWSSYVSRNLLPRVFGLELLMAPYAVAHMKLGLQLKDTGYDFRSNERLRVYLTNTLEESYEGGRLPFVEWLVEEAVAAGYVKHDAPIMVVLGNPPYSVHSANNGIWIKNLLKGENSRTGKSTDNYFEVDNHPLDEQNPKALYNDYVKFIRFAQWRIRQTGYGVLAFITDNSYLDGLVHRGMRQSLLKTFDDIYILDLHGNSKRGEHAPNGSIDQNVFDIQEGVAISIFIKYREYEKGYATIRHFDLFGARESKYSSLLDNDVTTIRWNTLFPQSPSYLFVPQNTDFQPEYNRGWKITNIMPLNSTGVKTHRDHFAIDFDMAMLRKRIRDFRNLSIGDIEIASNYDLRDTRDWKLASRRRSLAANSAWDTYFTQCLYRPFDTRAYFHHEDVVELPHQETMYHMIAGKNLGLITSRQQSQQGEWSLVGVTKWITECCAISNKTKEANYLFPLYSYPIPSKAELSLFEMDEPVFGKRPNLATDFILDLQRKLSMEFVFDGKGDLQRTVGPEDVFNYIYAILYCPSYRRRYSDLLRRDFPCIPFTSAADLFRALCDLGNQLVSLHLMEKQLQNKPHFDIRGSDIVETVHYTEPEQGVGEGRIWINSKQYFEGISFEVWNFRIGCYQVCQKWLKDRKGRTLTDEDLLHYQQIVAILAETIRLMNEVDGTILEYGGWPIV